MNAHAGLDFPGRHAAHTELGWLASASRTRKQKVGHGGGESSAPACNSGHRGVEQLLQYDKKLGVCCSHA